MKRILAGTLVTLTAATAFALTGAVPASAAEETVTDTPGAPIVVDRTSIARDLVVASTGTVVSVSVTVDIEQTSTEVCPAPSGDFTHFASELGVALVAPDGTAITLIRAEAGPIAGTYTNSYAGEPIRAVTEFTPDATVLIGSINSGIPVSGTFIPADGSLSDFVGLDAGGTWQVIVSDSSTGDANCYYGSSLTVTSTDPEPEPEPEPGPAGTVTDTPSAPIVVDDGSVIRDLAVAATGPVVSVSVSVDIEQSSSESCPAPVEVNSHYPGETGVFLTSPDGTRITLIRPADYDATPFVPGSYIEYYEGTPVRAVTTFTPTATVPIGSDNGGIPFTGTYIPADGSLADFVGLEANGIWQLEIVDSVGGDAKCYYGATLAITLAAPAPAAVLPGTGADVRWTTPAAGIALAVILLGSAALVARRRQEA